MILVDLIAMYCGIVLFFISIETAVESTRHHYGGPAFFPGARFVPPALAAVGACIFIAGAIGFVRRFVSVLS